MVVPEMPARVKEGDFATGERIGSHRLVALGEIARSASQGPVRECIRSPSRRGANVLEVKTIATNGLGRAAVLATVLGARLNPIPKFL
jgi:hypothetical protein